MLSWIGVGGVFFFGMCAGSGLLMLLEIKLQKPEPLRGARLARVYHCGELMEPYTFEITGCDDYVLRCEECGTEILVAVQAPEVAARKVEAKAHA